jgi:hypothetical protein
MSTTPKLTAILAIDPGPTESAYCWLINGQPDAFAKVPNETLREQLLSNDRKAPLVIEKIASFGMSVGAEVFETVYWSGIFSQCWKGDVHRITRIEVKSAICHDSRAKDKNIRQALIDRYGGDSVAIGRKANPGPLYGISGDVWSALAVGLTYLDKQGQEITRTA